MRTKLETHAQKGNRGEPASIPHFPVDNKDVAQNKKRRRAFSAASLLAAHLYRSETAAKHKTRQR